MPQLSDSLKVIHLVSSMTQGLSLVYILSHHTMNPSHPGWRELCLSTKEILSSPADKSNHSWPANQNCCPALSTRNDRAGPRQGHDLAHLSRLQRVTVSHWQGGGQDWWALLGNQGRQAGRQAVVVGGQRQWVASPQAPISYYA